MISKITGKIAHIDTKYIIVETNGIGYKIFIVSDTILKIENEKGSITLWTYLSVKENALDLYGFLTLNELNFFELLITISGIGPKTAIGILNSASVITLEMAIQSGDISNLVKMNGISKKIAEKIIIELKDKVKNNTYSLESKDIMKNNNDALEALKSLGYSQNEARDALKNISKEIKETRDKIREALKILGK